LLAMVLLFKRSSISVVPFISSPQAYELSEFLLPNRLPLFTVDSIFSVDHEFSVDIFIE